MSTSFHVQHIGAAGPSVEKLIRKFESMSTTSTARSFRRGSSVSELVEKYELLSCAAVSRSVRDKSTTGGRKSGKGGPVTSPLQPRGPHCKDERMQSKSSLSCGSYDEDRRHLHLRKNCGKNLFLARYYDRCGIEFASLETCSVHHHRCYSFQDTSTAPGTTTATPEVHDTTTMVAVTDAAATVSSSYIGSEKLYKTAAAVVADDVGNDGTGQSRPRRFRVDCKTG